MVVVGFILPKFQSNWGLFLRTCSFVSQYFLAGGSSLS
jgi:hypothetical protein